MNVDCRPEASGANASRRQFRLPEEDEEHLEARGLPWETVVEANVRWLIIHGFPVPEGYNHRSVSAAVMLNPAYPDGPLDMIYLFPHLARTDGKVIRALAHHHLDGETWQRWSRHRTNQNPWRPGVDSIASHLLLVEDWLRREFSVR